MCTVITTGADHVVKEDREEVLDKIENAEAHAREWIACDEYAGTEYATSTVPAGTMPPQTPVYLPVSIRIDAIVGISEGMGHL
jgi:hypothetical protein